MGTNILVYPVILSKNGDGYFVTVPDFTINTEGKILQMRLLWPEMQLDLMFYSLKLIT